MARPPRGYRTQDGKRVPGVTTVTSRFKDSGGLIHWAWKLGIEGEDYREKRDKAGSVGTLTHELIEAHLRGEEPWGVCEDPDKQALAEAGLETFKRWADASHLEVTEQEFTLVSEEHRYGGTPDGLGMVLGKRALLDWKTGDKLYPEMVIQVAAYVGLWEEHHPDEPIDEVHVLRLNKEYGSFHHHSFPRQVIDMGWDAFLKMRALYELDKSIRKAAGL